MSCWLFLCVSWPFYIYLLCFFICSISFCSSYNFISLLTFIHVSWCFMFLPLRALAILIIVILYSWSDHSNISVTTESDSDAFLFFFFFFASNCVFSLVAQLVTFCWKSSMMYQVKGTNVKWPLVWGSFVREFSYIYLLL